jgi:hypothetical protein
MELTLIQKIAVFALPVIFAITLHEAAHGYAALKFGDRTAKMLGRITLNPLKHIDPIGTILVPLAILAPVQAVGAAPSCSAGPSPCRSTSPPAPAQAGHALGGGRRDRGPTSSWPCSGRHDQAGASSCPAATIRIPLALMGSAGVIINAVLGAQPAADPAPGRRSHRRQPVAKPLGDPACRASSVMVFSSSWPAVHRLAEYPHRPDHRSGPKFFTDAFRTHSNLMYVDRVLSGMRPTGNLHLGHYHGVLKNWIDLQHEYECLFFVADWHALTTHYDDPLAHRGRTWQMVVDWLAAGVDPTKATLFIQSQVIEHAELHLLLSMMTPLGWLERVPTYKDQQEKLTEKDLSTYGFLGYPLAAIRRHPDLPGQPRAGGRRPGAAYRVLRVKSPGASTISMARNPATPRRPRRR